LHRVDITLATIVYTWIYYFRIVLFQHLVSECSVLRCQADSFQVDIVMFSYN